MALLCTQCKLHQWQKWHFCRRNLKMGTEEMNVSPWILGFLELRSMISTLTKCAFVLNEVYVKRSFLIVDKGIKWSPQKLWWSVGHESKLITIPRMRYFAVLVLESLICIEKCQLGLHFPAPHHHHRKKLANRQFSNKGDDDRRQDTEEQWS